MDIKQSSVEWLFGQIPSFCKSSKGALDAFEQAKAMHKEEIKEAYWNGSDGIETKTEILQIGEQYYNETFGGNDEK